MFMNRVHEQCPKIDLGKIPSRTGPKTGRVHQVHSPGQPAAPRPRALTCAMVRAHARVPACARAPAAPAPTPARPSAHACAPAPSLLYHDTTTCLATQAALSHATILQVVLGYNLASYSPSSHNIVQCIAIHYYPINCITIQF